jgi:signal transduction histidine kinase
MNSLERHLGIGLALVLAVVFAVVVVLSAGAVRSLSEAYLGTRLEHDAEALVAAVHQTPRGAPRMREGRVTPIYRQPLSGHYFVIRFDNGDVLRSRSLWDETIEVAPLPPGAAAIARIAGPGDQQLLARSAGYRRQGLEFTLLVAEDIGPLDAQIRHFQRVVIGLLCGAWLIALAVQRYLLRRGFRSLEPVRRDIERVAAGEQAQLTALGPSEVRPLSLEINRLLLQMQRRLQRSREALANLAHALKSPLARAVQASDALDDAADTRRAISSNLAQIETLIERELGRARLGGQGSGQYFDPAREVPDLVKAVLQQYAERELVIDYGTLPAGSLPLDRQDMNEVLGNLLDNACKHACGHVAVELRRDDGLRIRVADDGPGIPAAQRRQLPNRGTRLDETLPGHGLGLAIVQDIVDDYGGSLALGRSDALGGLEVHIQLPLHD